MREHLRYWGVDSLIGIGSCDSFPLGFFIRLWCWLRIEWGSKSWVGATGRFGVFHSHSWSLVFFLF
jgi:hypothetical protein